MFGIHKQLDATFDEALTRVAAALKVEGFGVLTEIDVRETLKNKLGVDFRPYKILGACNPSLAHEALSKQLDIGVLLPCNVVVYERDDGKAAVTAVDPMQTVGRDHPELRHFAEVVRDKLERVLAALG
jgi:uncharacterized protein (DUF302 family)